MRPALLLLLAALLGLTLAPYPDAPASASCVGSSLVGEPVLQRGAEQTVEGQFFHDGCGDTQSCGVGCSGCTTDDPESPMENVLLELRQGGQRWTLDTADATGSGDVTWTFTLPPEVRPGHARLVAGDDRPVFVKVR